MGWGSGPGMVAGEIKGFETCELGDPVVLEGPQAITAEALALPDGVVVVGHLQRHQLGSLAAAAGVVELGEIASQDRERPAIGGDVVVVEQQQVVLVIDGKEPCADQAAGGQIKRCSALLLQPLLHHGINIAIAGNFLLQREGSRWMDDLQYFAVLQAEGGAQRRMPFDQVCQRQAERVEVELAAEPPEGRQVISGEIGLELLEKPEAGLGVGGGEGQAARPPASWFRLGGGDGARSIGVVALPEFGDAVSE